MEPVVLAKKAIIKLKRGLKRRFWHSLACLRLATAVRNLAREDSPCLLILIAMPRATHLALVSLAHIQRVHLGGPVVLINNGCSKAESTYLRHAAATKAKYFLSTSSVTLAHHEIINILTSCCHKNLWLVDHDCLLFDHQSMVLAADSAHRNNRIGACFFSDQIPGSPLRKPHTFLLYINSAIYRQLSREYRIGAEPRRWRQLPKSARMALKTLGFDENHIPEPQKPFWDTLSVIFLLALSEGKGAVHGTTHSASFSVHPDAVHFGHTSNPVFYPHRSESPDPSAWEYGVIGAYYWRTCIDLIPEFPFRKAYLSAHQGMIDRACMRRHMIEGGISNETISFVDSLSPVIIGRDE